MILILVTFLFSLISLCLSTLQPSHIKHLAFPQNPLCSLASCLCTGCSLIWNTFPSSPTPLSLDNSYLSFRPQLRCQKVFLNPQTWAWSSVGPQHFSPPFFFLSILWRCNWHSSYPCLTYFTTYLQLIFQVSWVLPGCTSLPSYTFSHYFFFIAHITMGSDRSVKMFN